MKTIQTNRPAGFTLVEIMIVVAIIALLAAISIPNLVRARATSQANACINNLRQIESAVQQITIAKSLAPGDTVTLAEVVPYIKLTAAGSIPPCPAGGTYSLLPVGQNPQTQCSLSTLVTFPHVIQ